MSIYFLLQVPIKTKLTEPAVSGFLGSAWSATSGLMGGVASDVILPLELDAAIQVDHSASATITEFPIEQGGFINDHYIRQARRIQIEGMVTDTPIVYLAALWGGIGDITNMAGELSRSMSAYQALIALHKNAKIFDLYTDLDYYKNCVLESLNVPRNATLGKQVHFTATIRQVSIVTKEQASSDVDDLFATEEELGYLSAATPDPVTIALALAEIAVIFGASAGAF